MDNLTKQRVTRPEDEMSYDQLYGALASSSLFQKMLAHAMGDDLPEDSEQYSFVGKSALAWIADEITRSRPHGDVVDVGCGNGYLTAMMAKFSQCSIWGIDASSKAIELAKARGLDPSVRFSVADFCRLPMTDGSVSAITALDCVQHAPDYRILTDELARVCAPNSKLVVTNWMKIGDAAHLEKSDPFCSALRHSGFRLLRVRDLDPGLQTQFKVYACAFANKERVISEIGAGLYGSLMYEANHLWKKRGTVSHLGFVAERQTD